jgi:hypothetical protein
VTTACHPWIARPASETKAVFLCTLLALAALAACGDDDDRTTRFGEFDKVFRYRAALNPIIESVSSIELEVQQTAVGSSGAATAANLAAAYERLLPDLLATRDELDRLEPPRRLRGLHRRIGALIELRLAAYTTVVRGFASGAEALYAEAERMLADANALIVELNELLRLVDIELAAAAADGGPLAASKARGAQLF